MYFDEFHLIFVFVYIYLFVRERLLVTTLDVFFFIFIAIVPFVENLSVCVLESQCLCCIERLGIRDLFKAIDKNDDGFLDIAEVSSHGHC